MTALGHWHFLHPQWLAFLAVIPLWLWARRQRQSSGSYWSQHVDAALIPYVVTGQDQPGQRRLKHWLISLILFLSVIAIAGPSWQQREVPAFKNQNALVVALDVSNSMFARDLEPNRMAIAQYKLLDLLRARVEGQTALIVFAGDAFVVSPLTDDTDTISAQVTLLSPPIMPAQGSNITAAIGQALALLTQAAATNGSILLITDGAANQAAAEEAAQTAAEMGYGVSIMSVGTAEGGEIPTRQGPLKNQQGTVVKAGVDFYGLSAIASAGEGMMVRAQTGDQDIQTLSDAWQTIDTTAENTIRDDRQAQAWVNAGIWLVIALIPIVLVAFRYGLWLILLTIIVSPEPAEAGWLDWWKTRDQQAREAIVSEDYENAYTLFQNPDWKASAAYRAGRYADAAENWKTGETAHQQYNLGNALAQQQHYAEALAAYDKALAIQPNHEDALSNRELVADALEQQEKEQEQQPGQDKEEQDQQQGDEQQSQQNSESSDSQQSSESTPQQPDSPAESDDQGEADEKELAETEEALKQAEEEKPLEQQTAETEQLSPAEREQEHAREQWLRRIPDDPAGLWRRKFQYEYQRRGGSSEVNQW